MAICREVAVVERLKQESMYGLSAPQKEAICREVADVERLKQESMYGLSAPQKVAICREVAVSGGSLG